MAKNVNVQKGKKGFQPTSPKQVSPTNSVIEKSSLNPEPQSRPTYAPAHVTVMSGSMGGGDTPYKMIVSPEGEVYYKLYDDYGATYARVKVGIIGRLRYRKQIREAVENAWAAYDKLELDRQTKEAAEKTAQTFNVFENITKNREQDTTPTRSDEYPQMPGLDPTVPGRTLDGGIYRDGKYFPPDE